MKAKRFGDTDGKTDLENVRLEKQKKEEGALVAHPVLETKNDLLDKNFRAGSLQENSYAIL